MEGKKYYSIRASLFWAILVCTILMFAGVLLIVSKASEKAYLDEADAQSSEYCEYGSLISKLENKNECYLCGVTDDSLMDYYRKFDTVGVICLNQWEIIDLRLKEYDSEGNYVETDGNSSVHTNQPGVEYSVNATPSRGKTSATIKSSNGMFQEEMITQRLCQECLDKVSDTLCRDIVDGKEEYLPFCIVDFATLDLYPLQQAGRSYFVRDYWVQIETVDEEIDLEVFYLPEE